MNIIEHKLINYKFYVEIVFKGWLKPKDVKYGIWESVLHFASFCYLEMALSQRSGNPPAVRISWSPRTISFNVFFAHHICRHGKSCKARSSHSVNFCYLLCGCGVKFCLLLIECYFLLIVETKHCVPSLFFDIIIYKISYRHRVVTEVRCLFLSWGL